MGRGFSTHLSWKSASLTITVSTSGSNFPKGHTMTWEWNRMNGSSSRKISGCWVWQFNSWKQGDILVLWLLTPRKYPLKFLNPLGAQISLDCKHISTFFRYFYSQSKCCINQMGKSHPHKHTHMHTLKTISETIESDLNALRTKQVIHISKSNLCKRMSGEARSDQRECVVVI